MQHRRHPGTSIANAGSKPSELYGFGWLGMGAEHILLSYDEWYCGLDPHLDVVNECKDNNLN